jgi:hypothetical protein
MMSQFLSYVLCLDPTLLGVHQIEEGLDVIAIAQPSLLLLGRHTGGGFITPAALGHEAIPDYDLLVIRAIAGFKTPGEDFLIASTSQGSRA